MFDLSDPQKAMFLGWVHKDYNGKKGMACLESQSEVIYGQPQNTTKKGYCLQKQLQNFLYVDCRIPLADFRLAW